MELCVHELHSTDDGRQRCNGGGDILTLALQGQTTRLNHYGASLGGRSASWNKQLQLSVGWSAGRINRSTSLIILINDDKWITFESSGRHVVQCLLAGLVRGPWLDGYINKCTQHKSRGERKKERQYTVKDRQRKR